ncbi:hypothetical protein JXJ21_22275 [candidate division KSB1 bacterium]|nr:hypothetical protein [candidate division KSB1 bacterium]
MSMLNKLIKIFILCQLILCIGFSNVKAQSETFEDICWVFHYYGNLWNWGDNWGLLTGSSSGGSSCCAYMYYKNVTIHDNRNAALISFVFAYEDENGPNVAESYSLALSSGYFYGPPPNDFTPIDGSRGKIFNPVEGYQTMLGKPYAVMSDIPILWPQRIRNEDGTPGAYDNENGQSWWPGRMTPGHTPEDRWDTTAPFAASNRDMYYVFDDPYNKKKPMGLTVKAMTYDYGSTYAENLIAYDFIIINEGDKDLNGAYAGFYFKPILGEEQNNPDFLLGTLDTDYDQDTTPEVVYWYDPYFENPKSYYVNTRRVGVIMTRTPFDMGVTDFHFFNVGSSDIGPHSDEGMWAVITSQKDSPDLEAPPDVYFHGDDPRIDDTNWILDNESQGKLYAFYVMTGPFDLAKGDSTYVSCFITLSPNHDRFLTDVERAHEMTLGNFAGPQPPPAPVIGTNISDGKVTLYWDDTSERDPNFEGYKVYKHVYIKYESEMGEPVYDAQGALAGYRPAAQYDKIDGITGADTLAPWFNLGNDSGLKYSYVDSPLVNGINYVYAVTAYSYSHDGVMPLETPIRTIAATPNAPPAGLIEGHVSNVYNAKNDDVSYGVETNVINTQTVPGVRFKLTFTDTSFFMGDTLLEQGFNLVNWDSATFYNDETKWRFFNHYPVSRVMGEGSPTVYGIRFKLRPREITSAYIGEWNLDTALKDGPVYPYWSVELNQSQWKEAEAYEIVITEPDKGMTLSAYKGYGDAEYQVPFIIKDIYTQAFITDELDVKVVDFVGKYPDQPDDYNGPAGTWDLTPGGACYNPIIASQLDTNETLILNNLKNYSDKILVMRKGQSRPMAIIYTAHTPGSTAPKVGDSFYIGPMTSFPRDAELWVETKKDRIDMAMEKEALKNVRVVPNPYVVTAGWNTERATTKLAFVNLPLVCTIDIYNVAGDKIYTINHTGAVYGIQIRRDLGGPGRDIDVSRSYQGTHEWDMVNDDFMEIAPGLYIYVLKTPSGEMVTGKFSIIK